MTALTLDKVKTFFVKRFKLNKRFWARIEEPDKVSRAAEIAIYGLVITAFMALLGLYALSHSVIDEVALFLTRFNTPFDQIYPAFGIALIALINLPITLIYLLLGASDGDDVVEMITDLDSNIQERLTEVEATLTERLDKIERNA